MVIKLFLKDLRVCLLVLLPLVLLHLLNLPALHRSPPLFFLANVAFTVFLAIGATLFDLRYENDAAFASLPVRRSTIVYGRFLNAAFALALGASIFFGGGKLLSALIGSNEQAFLPLFSLAMVNAYLTGVLVPVCLFFPLFYGLGGSRGWIAFMALLLVLASVVFALGEPIPAERLLPDRPPLSFLLARFLTSCLRLTRFGATELGATVQTAMTAGLLALTVLVSALLSAKLYARRDL